jgi:hypothetical protein
MKHILFLLICCVEFPKVSIVVGTSFDLYFFIKMYFFLFFLFFVTAQIQKTCVQDAAHGREAVKGH